MGLQLSYLFCIWCSHLLLIFSSTWTLVWRWWVLSWGRSKMVSQCSFWYILQNTLIICWRGKWGIYIIYYVYYILLYIILCILWFFRTKHSNKDMEKCRQELDKGNILLSECLIILPYVSYVWCISLLAWTVLLSISARWSDFCWQEYLWVFHQKIFVPFIYGLGDGNWLNIKCILYDGYMGNVKYYFYCMVANAHWVIR